MGTVGTGFTTSLDGFIAGPGGDVGPLFDWYFTGDTEFAFPGGMVVKTSRASAAILRDRVDATGALVVGRRHFDETAGWGGRHPMDVPVFVVTHSAPPVGFPEGSPFTFVADGVESAIARARAVAGEKNVGVGGANVAQQAIRAGLIDEIGIDLVPILLGAGIRFFDHSGPEQIELERTSAVAAPGVTHLRFRVVK